MTRIIILQSLRVGPHSERIAPPQKSRNVRVTLLPVKLLSLFRIISPPPNFCQIFTGKSVAQPNGIHKCRN